MLSIAIPPSRPVASTSNAPARNSNLKAHLDADGESEGMHSDFAAVRQEEEEEGEEKETVRPARRPAAPKPKPTRKPTAKSASHTAKPKAPAKSKAKAKGKAAALEIEAEDLEFGQPARKTKRIQPSPPSAGLALPGSSSAVHTPSVPVALPPSSQPKANAISLAQVATSQTASDSEEDWDEVQTVPPGIPDIMDVDEDEGEDEEEIDMNAFEEEMNQQLNGSEHVPARPMSLNQFASGITEASQDEDDDYTSSEESDED